MDDFEMPEEPMACDLGKMWDGLHFILTGVSATAPLAGNPLSEAVVGTAMFSEASYIDSLSYIYPDRVEEISGALERFDIGQALSDFSPRTFAQNEIYPDIWQEEEKDSLKAELSNAFMELKHFYEAVKSDNMGIIVSIN